MQIERITIEGGFLDGFDVKLADGLNVLIGARGTGKTSVIELLRYALAARNHTAEAGGKSMEHATAVLGDGVVTVQLNDLVDNVTVSRAAGDTAPRASGAYEKPLIFSQTEIENVGLSEKGRLRLLDSFVSQREAMADEEAAVIAAIKSAFKELASLQQERDGLAEGLDNIAVLQDRIGGLLEQEKLLQSQSTLISGKRHDLDAANRRIADAAVREGVLERFSTEATRWSDAIFELAEQDYGVETWTEDSPDPLSTLRDEYAQLIANAQTVAGAFGDLARRALARRQESTNIKLGLEVETRTLRAEVEKSVAGAGQLSRQLAQAQTELAQLNSRRKVVDERDNRLAAMRERRDKRLSELDTVRSRKYEARAALAARLSEALAPQIKVAVDRYGQYGEYARSLTDALRGSGMRYNDLVATVTENISPNELVHFLDANDFIGLADVAGLPKDRAARLLAHLRETGAADIVTASIEDNVRMSLLDGVDYKDVEQLSAGQRCTVILSIVLQHGSRTLVIDQPEDHIDNAYIATTVVKAIRARKEARQLLISTHNANIPVLGGAALVIEMTSDGRNGFVQVCEPLEQVKAVEAITNVMEGGRAAFANRAAFYDEHER